MLLALSLPSLASPSLANNNPGALLIENAAGLDEWVGLDPDTPLVKHDGRWMYKFTHIIWGYRALLITLINYWALYDINTVEGIIERWTGPGDNIEEYKEFVAQRLGYGQLDMTSMSILLRIARAITHFENGKDLGTEWLHRATYLIGERSGKTRVDRE